jgi:HEAT repeat protein
MAAARALGVIGSPEAAEALAELFLDSKGIPSGVAFDALCRLGPAGSEVFRQGLRSSNATTRVESCFGIAATSGTGDVGTERNLLVDALSDGNARVRTAAARALGRLGGEVAPPGLREAVRDGDARVRREVVTALGVFDEPETVEVLARLVLDDDRETALRAAESLLARADRPHSKAAASQAIERSPGWAMAYARTVAQVADPDGTAA